LADYWFQKHREYSIKLEKSGQIYGIIKVKVDIYQLAESFIKRTRFTLLTGLAQALLFATGLFLLLRVLLTRPLEQLSDRLAHIDAHNPEKLRLDIPVGHENDELGRLAIVANQLLESIEEKVSLQHQLNEELEQRVAERTQRTQELAFANHEISALNERLAAENSRMGAELEITRKLQQMVLPKEEELAAIQELDIACFMQPATEVGGDYYDVLQEDGRVKIGIGDVTGHGLESGVVMLMVQMAVRTLLCHHEQNQREVLSTLNRALYGNIKRMQTDKNLTLALLDYQAGVLQLSGQHEDVLLVKQNGSIERIDTISLGFMVGLVDDISGFIEKRNFELERGDGVVLYTDGVTEAFNPRGECYGLDRLCQVVSSHWQNNTSQVIKQIIIVDIIEHLGGVQPLDDITLLVIKQK
jgi:serine phosphatase RsbU (regulator of sigma subunit)